MDIKAFLRDPEEGAAELGLRPESQTTRELLQQAQDLKAERQRLKHLKNEKSAVARAFKTVTNGSPEHADLVAQMQQASEAYKAVEGGVKAREKALRKALAECRAKGVPTAPPFYHIPPSDQYQGDFVIRELVADELPRWFQFVAQQSNSPAYCHQAWPEVIAAAFGHPTRIWAVLSGEGKILAGIPLTFFDSRLFGRFAVAIPYFNYGALLTSYSNLAQALLGHLESVCESERLEHIEIRTMQPGLWPDVVSKKVSMVLPLPKTPAALDDQLGAKVRAQCKKAERHEPDVRFGGLELLDDFYQVFAINMRDLGTPVYAKKWFRSVLSHGDIKATLVVVYIQHRPVSVGFLLGNNGMLEIPWASTVKAANAMDTNMWMYRQILDFAIREGYEFFDFGRSTRDSGTYRFKKQWGARPYEHYWYYILPQGGSMPGLNPDNPKYKFLIAAWQRLPVWLTKVIGPPLVKHIP